MHGIFAGRANGYVVVILLKVAKRLIESRDRTDAEVPKSTLATESTIAPAERWLPRSGVGKL